MKGRIRVTAVPAGEAPQWVGNAPGEQPGH